MSAIKLITIEQSGEFYKVVVKDGTQNNPVGGFGINVDLGGGESVFIDPLFIKVYAQGLSQSEEWDKLPDIPFDKIKNFS